MLKGKIDFEAQREMWWWEGSEDRHGAPRRVSSSARQLQ